MTTIEKIMNTTQDMDRGIFESTIALDEPKRFRSLTNQESISTIFDKKRSYSKISK